MYRTYWCHIIFRTPPIYWTRVQNITVIHWALPPLHPQIYWTRVQFNLRYNELNYYMTLAYYGPNTAAIKRLISLPYLALYSCLQLYAYHSKCFFLTMDNTCTPYNCQKHVILYENVRNCFIIKAEF